MSHPVGRKHSRYANAEQKRHHDVLRDIGCLISHFTYPTIAHCHGGSIIDTLGYSANPGWSQRQNHWLVIPLRHDIHLGQYGLDTHHGGVRGWEEENQTQIVLLEWICHLTGVDVFQRAGYDRDFTTSGAWENPSKPESKRQVALVETSQGK